MLDLDDVSQVTVNSTELAVLKAGDGDPLVLVHGGVSDLRTWSNQVDVFAEHFQTTVYSRRYHRPNAPIPEDAPDPIQTHVDDLAGLIGTLGNRPVRVVGHSWGALITLILATQKPELFQSMVLIEPPVISMHVNIPPRINQMITLFLRSPRLAIAIAKLGGGAFAPAEKAFRKGDDKTAIECFGRGVLGDSAFEALSPVRYQQVWDNRGPDRAQALHKGFPDLMGASFARAAMPTLLVSGSDSPAIFGLLIDGLLEHLPNARKCVIPGASHIVHEDAPSVFNSEVLNFIRGVD